MITRPKAFTFTAVLCLVLVASAAWACTAQTYLHPVSPAAVAAREKVTVQGTMDRHGPASAELRWNSADGPILGSIRTEGLKPFSIEVTVPQAAPGVHYLVLTSPDGTAGIARAAIEVLPPASQQSRQSAGAASSSLRALDSGLWGGFASSQGQLQASNQLASITETKSPALPLGLGLMAVGALGLLSGLAIWASRNKKLSAAAVNTRHTKNQ